MSLPGTLSTISSYLTRARSRLLMQFQNTYGSMPRIDALLQSWEQEIQLVENSLYAVYVDRQLQNPVTVGDDDLINKLGNIVGLPRLGMSNAQYITAIQAKIAANRSHGRKPELLNILTLLIPSTVIQAWSMPIASFYIEPLGPISLSPYIIGTWFLKPAISAGVALAFVWTQVARSSTVLGGSVYNPSFAAGPPPSNTGTTSGQSFGSVYNVSFSAGPPVTNAGGGVLAGVVEVIGGP